MKYLLIVLILLAVGCTEKTAYGPCVGLNDKQDPSKIYKVDSNNLILGIVFFETVFVPVIVAVDELYCPIGDRK
jgi:hypothetical protein